MTERLNLAEMGQLDLINGESLGTFPLAAASSESFVRSALFYFLYLPSPPPLDIAPLPLQPPFSPIPLADCLCTIMCHAAC